MSDPTSYPPPPPSFPPPDGSWDPVPLDPPPIIMWFKVYMVVLVVLHLLIMGMGFVFGAMAADIAADPSEIAGVRLAGFIYVIWGLGMTILYGATLFFPARPWAWIVNLVAVCISIMSGCCFLISIVLIIFWVQEDVRRWYGMR